MSNSLEEVEIPNRTLFKASEVCDILKVQPYVLRTWEAEFPDLGVAKSAGAPRVYRRSDVEHVARIKHLLLSEGLTLAGARRKLEEELGPVAADEPAIDELIGRNARERLTTIKRGLRSILELLSSAKTGARRPVLGAVTPSRPRVLGGRGAKTAHGKSPARHGPGRSGRARRK